MDLCIDGIFQVFYRRVRTLIPTPSFTVFQGTRKKSSLWGVETGLMYFSLGFTDGVSGKDNEQK